ncbi:hypothetical protein GCM10023210_13480 [Chryseobacterium ginsengisoli]|uniref:XRE family transcriptional regulator n=1 Tax=Chryseobacterium ginsengisoli TaxID=363853 RepID=A0ABP9M473_9FLAO
MYSISKKITIGKQVSIAKNSFINNEIYPFVEIGFSCCNCGHENSVIIKPYESGFPIFQIYDEDKVLSKNELLESKLVSETNYNANYLGELTVNNLATLYFGTDCSSCHLKYIGVFSFGEKQPGLEILTVSGIWNYKEIE